MATVGSDQFIVELVFDTTQAESALDQLVKSGAIDKSVADAFKLTNEQIKKQGDEAKKAAAQVTPLKKNLDDLAKSSKALTASFAAGVQAGITDALDEAGVSLEEFGAALTKNNALLKSSSNEMVKANAAVKQRVDLSGKLTISQTKEQATYNKIVSSLKSLTTEGQKSAKALLALSPKEVAAGFEELNISVEEYIATLSKAPDGAGFKSLRQELKETTMAIAQAKVNGDDLGPTYEALVARAGELKDAMKDANQEISNAGSDTRGLDNLLGTAQAVTAGFAVGQGVIGLFGDESEELQKTLLKVNSAMAVLQGLQQIQNALQKEGAITLLISNTQRKIQNAQLILNTGAESANVVVKYASIVAQKLLNAAMAANPIGLLVVAIAGLVTALSAYNSMANDSERQTNELNKALEDSTTGFEESAANIRKLGEQRNKALEEAGAKQSAILRANAEDEKVINQNRINEAAALDKEIQEKLLSGDRDVRKQAIALQKDLRKIRNDADDAAREERVRENGISRQLREEDLQDAVNNAEKRAALAVEGSPAQLAAQKAAIEARLQLELDAARDSATEQALLIAKAQKDRLQLDADYNRRRLDSQIKGIQNELILVREGTDEEYALRRKLLDTQMRAELTSTKLSEAERLKVRENTNKEIALLDRNFSEAQRKRVIENEISKNAAVISKLNANEQDKLELSIQNISYAAQLEVDAALGNSDKIKEINAKRDADILATRRKFIEDAAAYEAEVAAVDNAPIRRALEKRLAAQAGVTHKQRVSAIAQLGDLDVAAIDEQIKLQDELYQQYLISDKEYELNRKKLIDARVAAEDAGNEAILEDDKKFNQERLELILNTAQQVAGLLEQVAQIQADNENAELEKRRKNLDELEKAGGITEKAASERRKRMDAEEASLKRKQAVRDKALAVFSAVISTARGVAAAIPNPFLIALAAAIGAAQIAIIAARPIPQFATGKTKLNKYAGPAKVGETGDELIERDGRMYVVTKPTIVDLKKDDIVHTPHQTRQIMKTHQVDGRVVKFKAKAESNKIDYNQLAKVMTAALKGTGASTEIHIDDRGIASITDRHTRDIKYFMDRYKSFKR